MSKKSNLEENTFDELHVQSTWSTSIPTFENFHKLLRTSYGSNEQRSDINRKVLINTLKSLGPIDRKFHGHVKTMDLSYIDI